MGKEVKTNAMRILDKNKIPYDIINYECDEFIDGLHTAEATGAPVEQSFKTLVMQGKSKQYYVFVLPIAEEVDLKVAAKSSLTNASFSSQSFCTNSAFSVYKRFGITENSV